MSKKKNKQLRKELLSSLPYQEQKRLKIISCYGKRDKSWEKKLLKDLKK